MRLAGTCDGRRGAGAGEMEPGLYCALAKFGQAPCIVLGHDRLAEKLGPWGLPPAVGQTRIRDSRRTWAAPRN